MKLKLLYFGLASFVSIFGWSVYRVFNVEPTKLPTQKLESVAIEAIEAPKLTQDEPKTENVKKPVQTPKTVQNAPQSTKNDTYKPIDWDEVEQEQERMYQEEKKRLEKLYTPPPIPTPTVSIPAVKPVDSRPKCSNLLTDCIEQKQKLYGSGPIGAVIQYRNDCNRQISYMDCK